MNGTRVGYARCSTDEQDVLVQIEQLTALGVTPDRIYIDRGFSGTSRKNRVGLDQALAAVWNGSIFARNMTEACQILTDLSERGRRTNAAACAVAILNTRAGRRHPSSRR